MSIQASKQHIQKIFMKTTVKTVARHAPITMRTIYQVSNYEEDSCYSDELNSFHLAGDFSLETYMPSSLIPTEVSSLMCLAPVLLFWTDGICCTFSWRSTAKSVLNGCKLSTTSAFLTGVICISSLWTYCFRSSTLLAIFLAIFKFTSDFFFEDPDLNYLSAY